MIIAIIILAIIVIALARKVYLQSTELEKWRGLTNAYGTALKLASKMHPDIMRHLKNAEKIINTKKKSNPLVRRMMAIMQIHDSLKQIEKMMECAKS